jgi:hypothetical protein
MIIEEYYKQTKREFKAECLVETKMHKVGKVYKVITYAKPDSCIYVEDEQGYQHLIEIRKKTKQLAYKLKNKLNSK